MKTLTKKVDFAVVLEVNNANPNGDPLNGNRPRINYDGIGEISDVCIKRKLRNRFLDQGYNVFVQSNDYRVDEYLTLRQRAEGELKDVMKDPEKMAKAACEKWLDVRSFGQVFAYKSSKKGDGVSVGVRGPVSIHPAFSVAPINITETQITKSVSDEAVDKKGSDTMGMKYRVDHGVYVFYGSINTQLASRTSFSDVDAEVIKQSLIHLFDNDASSARPEGSMEVHKVIWWEHPNPTGKYSSAKVHRSLQVRVKEGVKEPTSLQDYDITVEELDGIKTEVYAGY
ncbi:MAG: type I-C CRISPR-associated protein Cas7/Csd2 [Bacillota bacterium]|jgi:CRISPR-associated protein Csd2|nr:type I-C CRISPR-associated protein Cas7/Csd2 [Bacillota bacterium]NLJ02579.1 type I-C CRISPR-associated protein Cas7/Csd2 [Bacillota bacterium]